MTATLPSQRLPRATLRQASAWLLVCALIASACPAAAEESGDALAASLKTQGDAALVDGRFAEALDAYGRANAIEPRPALQYNRGRALQALQRDAEALDALQEFQRTATPALLERVPKLPEMLALLRARVSTLSVHCNVPGATFRLGERVLALDEVTRGMHVNAGAASLVVDADGYLPFHKNLDLKPGATSAVVVHLLRRDESALLRVSSPLAGARVSVDGEFVSEAPAEVRVASGPHRVQVERPGYDTATLSVVLNVTETRSLNVALSAHGPITTRWWFWAGVAGAVVATSAVVIALSTEKSAGSGDIAPGTVSAPLLRFR